MKTRFATFMIACFVLIISHAIAQTPTTWESRGVGGGGAMFAPSINPADDNEFYAGCDMSELFHSKDFGKSYSVLNFKQVNGGHNSTVRFTSTPGLLYTISYKLNGNIDQVVPVKSIDNGITWKNLSGNPDATEETFTIDADYNNPQRVIISYYGEVHISLDGGTKFTKIHSAVDNGVGVIVGGVFFDGNSIYIGTNDGLLVSKNGGQTFAIEAIAGITSGEAIWSFTGAKQNGTTRFFCLTGLANDMYVGKPGSDYSGFLKGVYVLDYGNGNWTKKMNGITVGTDELMFVGMAQNDISTCYLAGSGLSAPDVMKTINGGDSWTLTFIGANNQNIASGWSGDGGDRAWSYGECAFGFAVAPNNSQKLLFGDFGFIHTSTNGGISWQQAYVEPSTQHPAGAKTPPGKTYKSIGLENTTCWQVTWSDANTMFSCFSDIKGVRSTDGGNTWGFNYTGHGANSMYRIAKSPTGTLYAGTSNIHDMYQSTRLADAQLNANDPYGKVIYSTDNGASWKDIKNFAHPVFWVALDPNNPNTLYASVIHSTQGGIYVSKNIQDGAGATWTKLPTPPRTEGHPASIVVLNDGQVVCTFSGRRAPAFTASSGCFLYNPTSNSWTDVSHNGMKYWTKDIVIDPNDPTQNTWLVSVFGAWGVPAAVGVGGLYRTNNRGQTWTRIWNSDRVTSCTFNPAKSSELYVTTEVEGLWYSDNANLAAPTFALVDSYPFRQPERVYFNPFKPDEIWVSSFGHGMRVGTIGSKPLLKAPKLLAPNDKSIAIPIKGKLQWEAVADADVYYVALSDNPNFTNSYLTDNRTSTTSIDYNLSPSTTYYWKAKGNKLTLQEDGNWSEVWSFTTEASKPLIPDTVKLLLPKDKSINVDTSISLVWKGSANTESFRVQISTVADFSTTILDKSGPGFQDVFGLAGNTTYYWHVQATNSVGSAPWSDTWSFTTKTTTSVENEPLNDGITLQVIPSPITVSGAINYSILERSAVSIIISDALGKMTTILNNKVQDAGNYSMTLPELSSGNYQLRLLFGSDSKSVSFLVTK
ncbi:MAG: exo-alpha-sialidase [Bacteroidetes bacterium]|nr:exo-alpha-sialidase [Bacteroidota bacterium]